MFYVIARRVLISVQIYQRARASMHFLVPPPVSTVEPELSLMTHIEKFALWVTILYEGVLGDRKKFQAADG